MANRKRPSLEEFPSEFPSLPKKRKTLNLFKSQLISRGEDQYGGKLNFETGESEKGTHVQVTSILCHHHPPAGTISRTRLLVYEDGTYCFQVLLLSKEDGKITIQQFLDLYNDG